VTEVVPDEHSALLRRLFASRMPGMFRKAFHAVRIAPGTAEAFAQAASHAGPVVVACNHQSWWDPLVGFLLHDRWFGDRRALCPMDRTQLAKFSFFRRLGVFGVDPDDAAGLRPFVRHVEERFAQDPRTVLMLTPQGQFVDPRLPVRIRPGAAMVLARVPAAHAMSLAVEYAFWNDRRPEVFLRAATVAPPAERGEVRAWERAIEDAMNANAASLAQAVQSRDPARFAVLQGGTGARTHPVYDLWLRVTGRNPGIDTAHRAPGTRA
jgi:hypothetical protein